MQFKKVIGQNKLKEKFIHTINESRISHAQLFLGQPGFGPLPLALAYAQYLSCSNKSEDACGSCPSCQKHQKLIHPDLHFVFPLSSKQEKQKEEDEIQNKWRELVLDNPYFNKDMWYTKLGMENQQGQIGKVQADEIVKKLSLKSFEGGHKIMIIWGAEYLNQVAANKLLKIIEEPPPSTLFILIAESSESILPTIISRTQIVKVPAIDHDSLRTHLNNQDGLSEPDIDNAIRLSNGNFLSALNAIESTEETQYNFEKFTHLMRLTYARKFMEIFDWVDELSGLGRERLKNLLAYCLKMIRENYMLNLGNNEIVYLSEPEENFSSKFNAFVNHKNAGLMAHEFANAMSDIERNGYSKLVLLDLSLKITKLIRR
jgi:DNA polymerase-3 subunit delta'